MSGVSNGGDVPSTPSVPHDLSLPCGCAGHCSILHVQHFAPFKDEQSEWYWDFFTRYGERSPWWWRIKLAWRVLWGRDHFCNAAMWSDSEIEPLRRLLNAHLPSGEEADVK